MMHLFASRPKDGLCIGPTYSAIHIFWNYILSNHNKEVDQLNIILTEEIGHVNMFSTKFSSRKMQRDATNIY